MVRTYITSAFAGALIGRSSERLPTAWILSLGRTFPSKSGNLAMLLAMRLAASSVSASAT